jgi:hypothetical protein
MNRSARLGLVAALIVTIVALLLLVDFSLLRGNLMTESQAATYTFGLQEDDSLPLEQPLDLYVDAPRGLADALADALARDLANVPQIGPVTPQPLPAEAAADGVLLVEIDEPSVFVWTPLYTRAVMTVNVAYASDGEVTWIEEEVVRMTNDDPVVRVRAAHDVDQTTVGLVSLPGYRRYLAEGVSIQIVNQLAGALE